jgi:sugar lactone lactonase YvrE
LRIMRKLLHTTIVILVLGAPAGALAQRPSVSLVMDSRGSVYYSDLSNVWRISPTGHRSIAVLAVHARQLYLDPEDRLFGEDLSTNDITGQPFHRIWRLDPDGSLRDVIPRRAGNLWDYGDFGFVRDRAGVPYALHHTGGAALARLGATGRVSRTTLPRPDPAVALPLPDGRVAVTAGWDLLRVDPRRQHASVWLANLARLVPRVGEVEERDALLGMWLDRDGRLYVAAYAGAAVIVVEQDGSASVAMRSPDGWSPTGGMVAPDGRLWLLEYSTAGQARVRRIAGDGEETVF